jgi:tetratricopeptide (TPR) repeat protein
MHSLSFFCLTDDQPRRLLLGGCVAWMLAASLWLGLQQRAFAQAVSPDKAIAQGIEEYTAALEIEDRNRRLAQFSRAEQLFQQAVEAQHRDNGRPSTELLVNLGNAALQANHVGQAIVAFRRALLQAPSHPQAAQNLRYARSTLPDTFRVDESTQLIDTLFFWRSLYSRPQLLTISAICFLCGALLFAASIAWKNLILRNVALLPWLLWAALTFSLWQQGAHHAEGGVITASNTILYSADSENSAPRLSDPLPDGTEVDVLEQRGRWTEVQVGGRTGWVHTADFTPVTE